MATEEVAPLSLTNKSKEFSTQMENTGSSGRRAVSESHCRTRSLEQRRTKLLEKCWNWNRLKMFKLLNRGICAKLEKLLNRRVLKQFRSGGQGRAFKSSMEASLLLQIKTQSLTAKFEF